MPEPKNYSEISPVDLRNPFQNPTEEPDYAPDYRDIVPNLELPESRLQLIPPPEEKRMIRRYYSLVFLMLLFAFFSATSVYVALQMLIGVILRQVDIRKLGELPGNYQMIVQQYMDDSSISLAINLIAFLSCNLIAFWVGCKITGVTAKECIGKRETVRKCGIPRMFGYMMTGLWLQFVLSMLGEGVIRLCSRIGVTIYTPEMTAGKSPLRICMLVLYGCIVAPITEELLLRGIALKNLSRVSQRFGILCSALLFGVMHENLPQFLFTFPLGIFLAYITIQHNSIFPAIIVHMTVNTFSVCADLAQSFFPQYMHNADLIYSLVMLALGSICFFYFAVTERLPDNTPHQSIRSFRIAAASPLLWALLGVHIGTAVLAAMQVI